jgi:hypothetical protein
MNNIPGIKGLLTAGMLLYASLLFSQTFTEQTGPGMIFTGVSDGSSVWGDCDNDGDIDILSVGYSTGSAVSVKVYKNNGSNSYSDAGVFSPAIPALYGTYTISAQWIDLNNDGFLDIVLNLPKSDGGNMVMIYSHEADHSYLLRTTINYWTWQGNSMDIGDYDNDGDQDLLIVTNSSSKIYQNQGNFAFAEQTTISLEGLSEGSSKFGDYDNDGDLDLLITGFAGAFYSGTYRIYRNNGNNSFTLQSGISISAAYDGSAEWGNYNNDGYLDILITGSSFNSRIFKNNGDNTFLLQNAGTLLGVTTSSGKWGDLDNDGDLDIVLSGKNNNVNYTKIYTNNGNNTFTELQGITLEGVYKSSVDLFDYDNDGDLDILLSGDNGSSRILKVYKNNSSVVNPAPAAPTGLTTETIGNDLILRWNSVTNDNTPSGSISYNVMVGTSSGGINVISPNAGSDGSHRVANMGNGQLGTSFILRNLPRGVTYYWKVQAIDNSWKGSSFASGPNFTYNIPVQAAALNVIEADGASATLAWTRGNGTNCAVFLKESNTGTASPVNGVTYSASTIFKSGSQINTSGWYCVYNGTGSKVSVTNLNPNTDYIFQVIEYVSTPSISYDTSTSPENPLTYKTGSFTEIKSANLPPVTLINLNNNPVYCYWIDLDNDAGNDLDLVLQGRYSTKIYRNDGASTFNPWSAVLENGNASACGDFNNDGLVDLAVLDYPNNVLYRNTGAGTFAVQPGFSITSENGSMDWGDYDNDGDLDILVIGESSSDGKYSRIYRNDGSGVFTEQQTITLTGLAYGKAKWMDYDNDGFLDLMISGYTSDAASKVLIYRNTGNNNFAEQTGIVIPGGAMADFDWGDYNNDGNIDFIIITASSTKIYRNDGNNSFTEQTSISLPSLTYGSVKWGDYDNDGDLDILLTGFTGTYKGQITNIFKNNGDNTFSQDLTAILPGIGSGTAVWGDYDKDGDLDIVLAGNTPGESISRIYRNDNVSVNTVPAAPSGITSTVTKSDVTLKWKSVRNDNTPYKAMTYNLMVGTSSGGINIVSPVSATNGLRRISRRGNAEQDTSFIFKKMPFGTYYWSVQAVNNSFEGGPFSSQGTFIVSPVQASSLSAKILSSTSLLLKWERGNGERCAVFAKQASTGQAVPVNNTGYVADPEIGFGSQIGASGWYCIYNGRADSVTIAGLIANKQYSFQIVEYMGTFGSEQYFTATADGNPGVFSTSLFTEQISITLNSGQYNNVVWGDYDNDGFIDLLIPNSIATRIYKNNGDNTFTEKTTISLPAVNFGSAAWGDYDKDGDLDILITGGTANYPVSGPLTKIYRNDGSDIFTEQTSISLTPLFYSSAAWGDYDNDGDLDILLNGAYGTSPNYTRVSKIYQNNGNNTFSDQTQITLEGLYRGSVQWTDYDNDGDLDIALTGAQMETQFNTEGVFKLYKNNGNNTFSEQTLQFDGVYREASNSATSWGDFDKDGDLDCMLTAKGFMTLYENLGGNKFMTNMFVSLAYQGACYAAWGDYDNDGYLDIILSNPGLDTKIYRNTHGISVPGAVAPWFNKQDDDAVKNIGCSFVNWVDYDNDGDLDFLLSKDLGLTTKIFKNNLVMRSGLFKTKTPPAAPSELGYTNTPKGVVLKWNPVKDNKPASKTLTYNLRIGTTKTTFNITPSHSSSTGYREIPAMGNTQVDTTYLMINMPAKKYYWSVQAVDQSFKGGPWSPVDSFEVKNVLAFFSADTVCQGLTTTFTNQSVAFGESIQSYKWIFENGSTSILTDPTYIFGTSGVKNVKLIAYSSNTSDTLVKQVLVKARPLIDFNSSVACLGTETALTNISNVAGLTIASWSWDYGDGKGSTSMNPGTHGYLNAGDYEVTLTASADNNCSGTLTKTITVAAYPAANISATTPLAFCKGDSVALSVVSNINYLYRWMSNGVDLTGATTNRQVARLTGNYTVEVTNLTGNCKTTSSPVIVTVLSAPAAPLISYTGSTTLCQGDSVLLSVSNSSGYSCQWKLNGGAVGTNSSQFYARSTGNYDVIVTNINGCSALSSNKIAVTVSDLPVVGNISQAGNNSKFCSGESITLSVPLIANYSYNWKRGVTELGIFTNSLIAAETGDYSVTVSTSLGCKTTTSPASIEVVEKPARPSIDKGDYFEGKCLDENPLKLSVDDIVPTYSYQWYRNGTPVSNSTYIETREAGLYYLEASYDICKSDTISLNVVFMPTLQKPELTANGSSVWYLSTTSNAKYYKWYFNGSLLPQAGNYIYVAGQKLGTYRVAISNDQKCYAYSDTIRIPSLNKTTAIQDTDPFKSFVLYPNPSSGLFNIALDNNLFGKLLVKIYNQDGKRVFDKEFDKSDEEFLQQIDLGRQNIGIYLISLYINGQFFNTKFVIE